MLKKLMIVLMTVNFNFAFAENCSFDVYATDQMSYNTKEIVIPSTCKSFTINFTNNGKMPKSAMGHNMIIAKKDDIKKIISDGLKSGITKNYIKPNDERIIAHTKLLGPGEKSSFSLTVDKIKNGDYVAFCSFPAHEARMNIKLSVK